MFDIKDRTIVITFRERMLLWSVLLRQKQMIKSFRKHATINKNRQMREHCEEVLDLIEAFLTKIDSVETETRGPKES